MKSVCIPFPRKLWLLLSFMTITAIAQAQILKGVVRDSASNPLVGAIVQLKGTAVKTTSMAEGTFAINLNGIPSANAVLEISYTGYQPMQILVKGSDHLTVVMAEKKEVLQEVVVTALGIRREEKSLGYAAQTVKENAVKDAKTNNWVNTLSGKVAGLNVQGTGSGPMGSSRVTLRGENSLNLDNNQALIIIDGVPVSSRITGTGITLT